ncbi:glycosyltransferase [Luteimonas sp. Sa2BVA3]|uniref:Glycosyltransferase n=1 Tax=Luteimonas colneyensis TaxID=2762230 RepID=A0ABR8UJX3_9GAMM|nr:glycosyltransferase [Luteimonas colneyensis]MBD7987964.1 glycosyltransferase [Luteimonas colneyensis]
MTEHLPVGGADARPVLLVLASTYPRWPGDPEPGFVHELAKRLLPRFRVHVLGPHARGSATREVMDGVEVHRYRYAPVRLETLVNGGGIVTNLKLHPWKLLLVPGFVLAQFWAGWRLCRRLRVDVLHAHWLVPQGLMAACLGWLPGRTVPFVVTSHGADLYALRGRLFNSIRRFVLRRASAASVVSSAMCDLLESTGMPVEKVHVLPMGVDVEGRFTPDPAIERSRNGILFVGRLVEKKGVRHLLSAMPRLLDAIPDAYLTIAGFGPDEEALREQVRQLGLESVVRFTGALPQSELPDHYRSAAVFVAPFVRAGSGDQEGLPVALMEAVSCGCPVVAGDIPGIGDLLGRDRADVCVDARDEAALASRIIEVLADPVLAQERACRIRTAAARHVDWARIADGYATLLVDSFHGR